MSYVHGPLFQQVGRLAFRRSSYLVTYPVQIRLHKRIRLLQQVVEDVEGAELPGLPLVVDPTRAAVTVLHDGASRSS